MQVRILRYTLELKHRFSLAPGSRTTTPVILVEVEREGVIGYGEASMPPYLGESHSTAEAFLSKVDLTRYDDFFCLDEILSDIDRLVPGNHAAKAAVDIALHDWVGKKMGQPWHRIWGLNPARIAPTSFTIGIGTRKEVQARVSEAEEFCILKAKLGGDNDRAMIEAIREVTDKPIRVDVNQGWQDRNEALTMIEWLAAKGVELVEQPMPKEQIGDLAWLRSKSPLPIIADESVTRLPDVLKAHGIFDGINIKLMKCTGMREAYKMIVLARSYGMKVMIGCMTETSCAISAAAHLSPLADWVDLDGAFLIGNDPFHSVSIIDGKVRPSDEPGIGVRRQRAIDGMPS